MDKSPDAFRTISEVADWLGIPAHVLRFWESKFTHVKPVKRAGGRRYYRPADMQLLGGIKNLLHDDGLTIKGVQKILREQGVGHVSSLSQSLDQPTTGSPVTGDETVLSFKSSKLHEHAPSPSQQAQPEQIEMLPTPDPVKTELPPEPTPEPAAEKAPEPVTAADSAPVVAAPVDASVDAPASPAESPAAPADTAPTKTATPQQDVPPDAKPVLPSFLHRPADKKPVPKVTEPAPEPVAAKRPGIVDAPDPADESDLPYTPGPLTHLAGLHALTADQARAIAPLARQLRDHITHTGNL